MRSGQSAQLGLSAFSLPKLKRDVAAKLHPREGGSQALQAGDAHPTAADSNNTTKDSKQAQTAYGAPAVDTASPAPEKSAKAVSSKPATAKKGRRTKQTRVSEQHTVYYDALGSPDDASTGTHQRTGMRAAVPTSAYSKTPKQAAADAGICAAGYDEEFFTSQPEPMEEDDLFNSFQDAVAAAPAAATDTLAAKSPAVHHKRPSATPQARDQVAPRPSSRQQRHTAQQAAAAKQEAAAAAAAADAKLQGGEQQNKTTTSRSRGMAAQAAVADAAAMALDDDQAQQQEEDMPAAAGHGSQEQMRGGQEIYKYMKQLADDAAELLPQEEAEGGKKRGRGRPKKDLRLVDALHQCWQGKSYYERLQEITRQEMQEEEEQQGMDDTATLSLHFTSQQAAEQLRAHSSGTSARGAAAAAEAGAASALRSSQDARGSSKQAGEAGPTAAAGKVGSQEGAAVRKRRTGRQGPARAAASTADADAADVAAGEQGDAGELSDHDGLAVLGADAVGGKAPSNKRRATLHAAAAAAAAPAAGGGSSRQGRRATVVGSRTGSAAAAAAVAAKSPLPGAGASRPNSSRLAAAWDATPAAAAVPASLADRPPFTVGGSATGGAGAAGGGAGAAGGAAVGTAKADRGALQKLQAAFDAKCEELLGVKDQLKDSQEAVSKLRQEAKAHPKALQQLEKQKQALEKKLDGAARKEAALTRDNEALQERLTRQEEEKAALQEQLSKSERDVKALRLKLKQAAAKLEKAQTLGTKLQELGVALVADAQPPVMAEF